MKQSNLNVVKNIIKDSLNSNSATTPKENLEYVEDWINLIQEDMDLLIKFDTQTILNSFKGREKIKPKNKINEVNNIQKERIQCLIGL